MMMQIRTMTTASAMKSTKMTKAANALPTAMTPTLTKLPAVPELLTPSDSVAACRYITMHAVTNK